MASFSAENTGGLEYGICALDRELDIFLPQNRRMKLKEEDSHEMLNSDSLPPFV